MAERHTKPPLLPCEKEGAKEALRTQGEERPGAATFTGTDDVHHRGPGGAHALQESLPPPPPEGQQMVRHTRPRSPHPTPRPQSRQAESINRRVGGCVKQSPSLLHVRKAHAGHGPVRHSDVQRRKQPGRTKRGEPSKEAGGGEGDCGVRKNILSVAWKGFPRAGGSSEAWGESRGSGPPGQGLSSPPASGQHGGGAARMALMNQGRRRDSGETAPEREAERESGAESGGHLGHGPASQPAPHIAAQQQTLKRGRRQGQFRGRRRHSISTRPPPQWGGHDKLSEFISGTFRRSAGQWRTQGAQTRHSRGIWLGEGGQLGGPGRGAEVHEATLQPRQQADSMGGVLFPQEDGQLFSSWLSGSSQHSWPKRGRGWWPGGFLTDPGSSREIFTRDTRNGPFSHGAHGKCPERSLSANEGEDRRSRAQTGSFQVQDGGLEAGGREVSLGKMGLQRAPPQPHPSRGPVWAKSGHGGGRRHPKLLQSSWWPCSFRFGAQQRLEWERGTQPSWPAPWSEQLSPAPRPLGPITTAAPSTF